MATGKNLYSARSGCWIKLSEKWKTCRGWGSAEGRGKKTSTADMNLHILEPFLSQVEEEEAYWEGWRVDGGEKQLWNNFSVKCVSISRVSAASALHDPRVSQCQIKGICQCYLPSPGHKARGQPLSFPHPAPSILVSSVCSHRNQSRLRRPLTPCLASSSHFPFFRPDVISQAFCCLHFN